jgi:GNAT superfamily N-acetyltransferase
MSSRPLPPLAVREEEAGGGVKVFAGSPGGGAAVTTLKVYGLAGELRGRALRVAGIGDLVTVPEHRRRGYAAALLEAALDAARRDGCGLALVHSTIGEEWFARLGFARLPAGEASCVTSLPAPWPGEPPWVGGADPPGGVPGLRAAGPADVVALAGLDAACGGAPFRLIRDRAAWERALGAIDRGGRDPGAPASGGGGTAIWMIEEGGDPVAYAVVRESGRALRWLGHGARPEAGHRLADLFWAAIALARRRGLSRLEGWHLPAGAGGRTLYPIARRQRRSPLLLARLLDPGLSLAGLDTPGDCPVSEMDRF